jgi:hypothetical protein
LPPATSRENTDFKIFLMKAYRVNFTDSTEPYIYAATSSSTLIAHVLNDRPINGGTFADQLEQALDHKRSPEYDLWAANQSGGNHAAEKYVKEILEKCQ